MISIYADLPGVVGKVYLKKSKFKSFRHFQELTTCVNRSKQCREKFPAFLQKNIINIFIIKTNLNCETFPHQFSPFFAPFLIN